ncbi:MAG TPA: DUF4097 family beta strand repeat-containing protein [Anaerolineales bacterium]|nr:DUF4097 family beta strand repeat-containing protein [Anaerolineales bacterium]
MSEETIEKTFQVGTPARLIISNVRGSVTIQPGEPGLIVVKAFKHGDSSNANNVVEMTQDSDGTVRVETRHNESFFGLLSYPPRVEYSIRIPQGTHLEASCVSSSLNVSDLAGVFKLKTISGEMEIANLSGPFKLSGVSGDITGSHLEGVLELSTVSGRVKLLLSEFSTAEASTVSGELILQTPVSTGPYTFSSVSGSVRMLVPPDTHCNAELNTVSGSIRSSIPASTTRIGHGLKITQVGSGGTSVRLKSVSGSLSFEVEGQPATNVAPESTSSGSAAPQPPTPPAPPPQSPMSTAEILEHIERGEMTVDEAIKMMKGQS